MVLDGYFDTDTRLHKEILALSETDICVHVLSRYDPIYPRFEKRSETLYIHRLINYQHKWFRRFWQLLESLFLVNWYIQRLLSSIIKTYSISVVHVHDLPLFNTAYFLKKRFFLEIVADFHENYPIDLLVWISFQKGLKRMLKEYLFNSSKWFAYEKKTVERADFIIVTVEEMKHRLMASYPVKQDKFTIFRNTQDVSFLDQKLNEDIVKKWKEKNIVLYIGGISTESGLLTAVQAMKLIDSDLILLIVGAGDIDYTKELKALVAELGLNHKVIFEGLKPFSDMLSYIKCSKIGLLPHVDNEHIQCTTSHKMFQYMLGGLPIISSKTKAFARIVNDAECGLCFKPVDPSSLALVITTLYEDRSLYKECSKRAFFAAKEGDYSFLRDKESLVSMYKQVFKNS